MPPRLHELALILHVESENSDKWRAKHQIKVRANLLWFFFFVLFFLFFGTSGTLQGMFIFSAHGNGTCSLLSPALCLRWWANWVSKKYCLLLRDENNLVERLAKWSHSCCNYNETRWTAENLFKMIISLAFFNCTVTYYLAPGHHLAIRHILFTGENSKRGSYSNWHKEIQIAWKKKQQKTTNNYKRSIKRSVFFLHDQKHPTASTASQKKVDCQGCV